MAYRHIVKSIRHSISETDYRIKIAIPKEPAPEEGYPVFYILDGNAYGVLFESVVMLQAQRTEKTGVPLAVIVSIGYAQEEIFSPLRIYDFTPQSEVVNLPERPSGVPWPTSGGAEEFLKVIKKVKRMVRQEVEMDVRKQLVFGHSLGGLFLVQTLILEPELFTHYYICSPSLWWNQEQILQDALKITPIESVIFIASEQQEKHKMFENVQSLYNHLKSLPVQSVEMFTSPDENHMSIIPASMCQALRFLMKNK